MENALVASDGAKTLVPACLKVASYKVIELFEGMYLFLETNCGNTYLFKVIHYFKPSENTKEMILGIIGSYGAWFDFEGGIISITL